MGRRFYGQRLSASMLARAGGLSYKASTMGTPRLRGSRFRRGDGVVLAGCVALGVIACAETTAVDAAPRRPRPAPRAAKEVAWADMVKEQRIDYMKSVVLPRMKQAFTQFNPDRYAKMNCMTCHGDSATEGSFKMPNPRLPVLPNSSRRLQGARRGQARGDGLHEERGEAEDGRLLGTPEWNPETKTGFGCMACHTTAQ